MKKQTAGIAACSIIVALTGFGIASATAAPNSHTAVVESSEQHELSPQQQDVFGAYATGAPVGVVDTEGHYRGVIDTSTSAARDDRILAEVQVGFREPESPYDADYERLWEALAVLDPVAVTDDSGDTVGYWIGQFVTAEELEAAQGPAQETVATLMG
jgi:hypothetical protein